MSGIPHEQRISWYLTNNFTDVHYPLPMGRTYLDANFFFYQTGYLPHVMPGDTYIESSADGYFYFTDLVSSNEDPQSNFTHLLTKYDK